jgi:cation diffusion facilitator CzcD-associated flavoprotein CzcO
MSKDSKVAVVGAGPAGTATVGCLLEKGYKNIVWVDPHFEGGELQRFWSIPSNTRAMFFKMFANLLEVFSKHANSTE